MRLAADCVWTLARGGIIGAAGVAAGAAVYGALNGLRGWRARAGWALVLLPYLTPVLLVAYGYRGLGQRLVRHPGWLEAVYCTLLWLKLTPIAVLALRFAPRTISPEGTHCYRLLQDRARTSRLGMLVHGPLRGWAVGFSAVFLLAFGEFEIASLLQVRAWTVTVFDAHAGGVPLSQSVRLALLPAACEALVLGGALLLLFGGGGHPRIRAAQPAGKPCRWTRPLVIAALVAAAAAVSGVPLWTVMRGTLAGLSQVLRSVGLWNELAATTLFAAGAAACAYLVADLFLRAGRRPLAAVLAACAPGLMGTLVLALVIMAAFQMPGLRALRDSPAPLVLCLALLLLPVALMLTALAHALLPGRGIHAARLLAAAGSATVRRRGAELERRMRGSGRFWTVFLLFCWAYFDVVASSILSPSRTNPVFALLYNQMHYGQIAMLSAWVLVAFCVPIVALAVGAAVRGLARRAPLYIGRTRLRSG